jgi:hypothetical protein
VAAGAVGAALSLVMGTALSLVMGTALSLVMGTALSSATSVFWEAQPTIKPITNRQIKLILSKYTVFSSVFI